MHEDTLDAFLIGVDIVLDECDDLAMKVLLRERARAGRVPVVMVTSDRGLLDVERFDREPGREPFHGVLAGQRAVDLCGLTTKQKVPYVLRIIDAERIQPRLAASLVEVGPTLSTWPQLASDVALGGMIAANAVRRIALGEVVMSGRYEVDLNVLVRDGSARPAPAVRPWVPEPARSFGRVSTHSLPEVEISRQPAQRRLRVHRHQLHNPDPRRGEHDTHHRQSSHFQRMRRILAMVIHGPWVSSRCCRTQRGSPRHEPPSCRRSGPPCTVKIEELPLNYAIYWISLYKARPTPMYERPRFWSIR